MKSLESGEKSSKSAPTSKSGVKLPVKSSKSGGKSSKAAATSSKSSKSAATPSTSSASGEPANPEKNGWGEKILGKEIETSFLENGLQNTLNEISESGNFEKRLNFCFEPAFDDSNKILTNYEVSSNKILIQFQSDFRGKP